MPAAASAAADLFAAIASGDDARARTLAAKRPDLVGARDEQGRTPVVVALYHRRTALAAALASAGPGPDLFESAGLGDAARVAQLLEADPSGATAWSADGFTALHYAAFFGHAAAAARLLAAGADPDATARNPMKVRPIHSAAAARAADVVKLLLEHGAQTDAAQQAGWTALHAASHHGDAATAALLLARGADPGRANDDGRTAADMARGAGPAGAEVLALFSRPRPRPSSPATPPAPRSGARKPR